MAASSRPAFVFVHGAWHGAQAWERITKPLEAAGHRCVAVSLPSVGAKVALEDFQPDVQAVRTALLNVLDKDHQDCILVMHSYGGLPGTEAARELAKTARFVAGEHTPNGVVRLVYVTSFALTEGQSLASWERPPELGPRGESANFVLRIEARPLPSMPDNQAHFLNGKDMFYNDLAPDDAEYWNTKLRPHSVATWSSPLTYAAWRDIPSTYLLCTKDTCIPLIMQEKLVKDVGGMETESCDAGHSPFLSQPKAVADLLQRLAGKHM